MSYPMRHTIQTRAYVEGAENSHGNPVDEWAEPVDADVYGWAQPQSDEPKLAGRDALVVELEVFGPDGSILGRRDKAVVADVEYEVIGDPEDYNHGPFGWEPGYVFNLRRAEG